LGDGEKIHLKKIFYVKLEKRGIMNKEIERKYAIKYLPDDIKIESIKEIEQAFIYRDKNTIIRIRKIEARTKQSKNIDYIYTVKTKGDIQYDSDYSIGQKYEIESNISEKEYNELIKRKISNIIHKTRVVVPIEEKLKVEIDIYYDYLDGLLTAEIEFPSEEMAKEYQKTDWLGEELGYKKLSNRKLAEMTKEEFSSKVSKDFMENNKKIIALLKSKIQKCY
jgi:CYTH domain-containing protein